MTDDEIFAAVRAHLRGGESPGPASAEAVAEAEQVIGYRLPRLLRRLYLEVANGGFGPHDGVLGVSGGRVGRGLADIVDVYTALRSDPEQRDPAWLVWLFDWAARSGHWSTAAIPQDRCGAGSPMAAAFIMASSPSA